MNALCIHNQCIYVCMNEYVCMYVCMYVLYVCAFTIAMLRGSTARDNLLVNIS